MSGQLQEFKEFALKGNAIALAIGVVMGAAFNAIVTSIVDGIFSPLIGVFVGGVQFATATATIAGVTFKWVAMVDAIINFIAVALALFVVVKIVAKFDREPDSTTRACPHCTTEISKSATRCPACTSEVTAEA